jgi:uncharacterized protein YqeY
MNLQEIETQLKDAMKAKDAVAVGVLRGLKTRVQNEQIAKQTTLTEDEIFALIRSEIKKRKEASESYTTGGRLDLAEKETQEAEILNKFLPALMSEAEVLTHIEQVLAGNNFTASDFGKAMGAVKAKVGNNVDNALVAKLLKQKLK